MSSVWPALALGEGFADAKYRTQSGVEGGLHFSVDEFVGLAADAADGVARADGVAAPLWPRMTQVQPASLSMGAETSPVKRLFLRARGFRCRGRWRCRRGLWRRGAGRRRAGRSRRRWPGAARVSRMAAMRARPVARSRFIFQLPATKGRRMGDSEVQANFFACDRAGDGKATWLGCVRFRVSHARRFVRTEGYDGFVLPL